MNSWLNYMMEANLCLCMVLGLYLLFLRRQTSFHVQRLVLLAGSLGAITLPLIHADSGPTDLSVSTYMPAAWLPEVVVTPHGESSPWADNLFTSPLFLVYAGVCTILIALFLIRLRRLLLLIFNTPPTYELDGFKVIEMPAPFTTFSFFRFIFLGGLENISTMDKERMLRHEMTHGKSYHSIDMLWIHTMQVFFWMNPVIPIYRKIFIQLHEFEADARAAENDEVNEYCSLLAKVALKSADFTLANHFSNSLIIKRINMIRMHKTGIAPWRMAMLLSCALGFFYFIVSSEQVMAQQKPPSTKDNDPIFMAVEQVAEYKDGGLPGMATFIGKNLKYPESARNQGIEGTVFVSLIIEKDGTVSETLINKGVSNELDEEAMRVVKLTQWIPGKQSGKTVRSRLVLPIKYKL